MAALPALAYAQGVPPPPPPPAVPAGSYCATIYNELTSDLQAFNTVLATPPTWSPIPGGPTLYGANLQWANSNTGPSISGPNYMQTVVQAQLQEMKALGIQAVSVPVLFPVLYEPFYGSASALAPYTAFYAAVAQAVRAAGLKLIIDNEILFSNDIAAGWTNMNAFYSSLTWPEYLAARAEMAATIETTMKPDYLMLANEPDTEALQTGQTNLNNPVDAALMVAGEITAVQTAVLTGLITPVPKLGAGFGTWMPATGITSLLNYITSYVALPLDYIDYHLLPINTVSNSNFLTNALTITQMAAAVGKPAAISQAFVTKETADEWDVLSSDVIRARGPFSFWAPLDNYFNQTAEALAKYTNMLYMVPQFPVYLFAQQTYGGTTANGGAANCTCTTATCSDGDIMATENQLAGAADQQSVYTDTAVDYYNQLVTTPDTTPPSVPPSLTGTPGFTTANLSWGNSSDNIGVAGYNLYRCTPPAAGQPCTGVYLATMTLPGYSDSSLTSGALYNYQVQAFDFVNNNSPLTPALSLQTYITSSSAAQNLVATTVSPQEIGLSWSPPSNPSGLGSYLIYSGTSHSNLQQIAVRPAGTTTYNATPLAAQTAYYFGIVAVEQGIDAPMTPVATATTLPLPSQPSNVAGTPSPTKIVLTWQEYLQPNGLPIGSYEVFEGATAGDLAKIASTTGTTYTATSLTPNTTYYFEIVAVDTGHDDSVPSNQIAVSTDVLPNAPLNVAAAATSNTKVTVTWSASSVPSNGLPISSYTVFRGTTPTSITTNLGMAGTTPPLKFVDTKASANTTYYYGVKATDNGQDVSPLSAPAEVTTPSVPAAPVDVGIKVNSATELTVTWTENIPTNGLSVASYTIDWGTTPTSLTNSAKRTTPTFIDTGLSPNTTYYFAITATDSGGDVSPASATVHGSTAPMPAAPSNVAAAENSSTQITVTWSENIPTGGLSVSSYAIYRGTTPTGLTKLASRSATKYIDTGLTPGVTYYYYITATDSGGDVSPPSATVNATTP